MTETILADCPRNTPKNAKSLPFRVILCISWVTSGLLRKAQERDLRWQWRRWRGGLGGFRKEGRCQYSVALCARCPAEKNTQQRTRNAQRSACWSRLSLCVRRFMFAVGCSCPMSVGVAPGGFPSTDSVIAEKNIQQRTRNAQRSAYVSRLSLRVRRFMFAVGCSCPMSIRFAPLPAFSLHSRHCGGLIMEQFIGHVFGWTFGGGASRHGAPSRAYRLAALEKMLKAERQSAD